MSNALMNWWAKSRKLPLGKFLFNKTFFFNVPYTATIRPNVLALRPGYARVSMRDRRRVRNHLKSVHAIAQMNLGELVTGLAMTARLSPDSRAIITKLEIEFVKKARGRITAECTCPEIDESISKSWLIESELRDESGEIVSKAIAHWLVGPRG